MKRAKFAGETYDDMKKYPVVNFKSPVTYNYILLMLALAAIPVLMIIKYDDFWLYEIAFIAILFLLVILLYPMAGKVIVGDTSLKKRTIFGSRSVKIGDIKSFGVMKQEGELGVRILGRLVPGYPSKNRGLQTKSVRSENLKNL